MTREEIKEAYENGEAVKIDYRYIDAYKIVYITGIVSDNEVLIGNTKDTIIQKSTITRIHRLYK